ncbi:hypothetical protein U9M48_032961 [Paspalum notatum var. saurae]|uniref:Uncharacterized protein n=1 Tax=Paspalum notatum var. saurae TaxID=547442 RepID=A0AAQ3X529_PASNO
MLSLDPDVQVLNPTGTPHESSENLYIESNPDMESGLGSYSPSRLYLLICGGTSDVKNTFVVRRELVRVVRQEFKMNSSVESFSVDPMSTVPASPKLDAHNVESCTGDDLDDQALKKPDCCDLNDHDPLASAPSATIEISSLKIDSRNIESCIDENLDDRPFKKAKCSESSDFDEPDKKPASIGQGSDQE